MRTSTDVLRSMVVYLASALGDWEVRIADEEGAFDRPFCKVAAATPMRSTPHGPVTVDCLQTFAIVCYPVEAESPVAARMEAEAVVERLFQAFMVGVHAASHGRKHNTGIPDKVFQRGHPMRVPLYDFDGVDLFAAVSEEARATNDFILITDPPTFGVIEGTSRSDEEETLYTVTGEVRCKWTRATAVISDGVVVEEVLPVHTP